MIIDIGTGVDESVVMWKYNDKDKWRDADIDELIHLYESIVHCKDCRQKHIGGSVTHYYWCDLWDREVDGTDFCAWGERKEP